MHFCKIVNNKVWTKADEGTQSVLLHTSPRKNYVHPVCKSGLCPPSPLCPPLEGGPKSLISRWGDASEARVYIRAILGGGWTSPLLHIRHSLKSNGARHIYLSKGEEKNLLANEMSLQILGGGQLCASNMPFYVKPMLRL